MVIISKEQNLLRGDATEVSAEIAYAISMLNKKLVRELGEETATDIIKDICELGITGRVGNSFETNFTKKHSKFHKGDKFVVEIAERHTHYTDDGKAYNLYRIKGFNSLVLDDYGIQKLIDIQEGEKE